MSARFPFSDFPTGWYAVGFSDELAAGSVQTVKAFGQELLLFRTASGTFATSDPFCPHLGAHLGGGKMIGDTLRCPFHQWEFNQKGACVRAYGENVPRAGLSMWASHEQNGVLLVFYPGAAERVAQSTQAKLTRSDLPPPPWRPPSIDGEGWTPFRFQTLDVASHPQETSENSVDLGHFAKVHAFEKAWQTSKVELEGPVLRASYGATRVIDVPDEAPGWLRRVLTAKGVDALFDVEVHGLGFSYVQGGVPSIGLEYRHLVLSTPVEEERITLRIGTAVKRRASRMLTELGHRIAFAGLRSEVARDIPLWERKRYVDRPTLAQGDGPVHVYRRWARQFYPDATAAE